MLLFQGISWIVIHLDTALYSMAVLFLEGVQELRVEEFIFPCLHPSPTRDAKVLSRKVPENPTVTSQGRAGVNVTINQSNAREPTKELPSCGCLSGSCYMVTRDATAGIHPSLVFSIAVHHVPKS